MTKKFIVPDGTHPSTIECNQMAARILPIYGFPSVSVSKLKKMPMRCSPWTGKNGVTHQPKFTFKQLTTSLRDQRAFCPELFDLPPLRTGWMDNTISLGANTAAFKMTSNTVFGAQFPIKPTIQGPGAVVGSFQGIILMNILRLYKKLIDESENGADLHAEWFNSFRLLINESVSIVEITLHQIYYMAKYQAPQFGWTFNEPALGSTVGRRIKDKFAWIHSITGRHLNAGSLMDDFIILKDLRNHLNHFDPPCFAFEVTDMVAWLNLIPRLGRLLLAIRETIQHPPSGDLIRIVLLPTVMPNPQLNLNAGQAGLRGYASSTWPAATP